MQPRWMDLSKIWQQARDLKARDFETLFPHPVLVAGTVRGGRLLQNQERNATHLYFDPDEEDQAPEGDIPPVKFTLLKVDTTEMAEPWVTIGRTSSSDLVINDYTVSKDHARLLCRPGRYMLEDVGSRNGTWLGEDALRRFDAVPIKSGAEVRFGRQTFTFFDSAGFWEFITQAPPASGS